MMDDRKGVCCCVVGNVRRPPIARLFSLGAACGVQVQMLELCCVMEGLEKSGEARGGVDQRRQALGRGNTRASGRKKTVCSDELNIYSYPGDLALQW